MEVVEVAGGLRFLSRIEGGFSWWINIVLRTKKGGVTFHPAHLILIEVVESIYYILFLMMSMEKHLEGICCTPLKTNRYHLKIDGWKISFPFKTFPFQGTFAQFGWNLSSIHMASRHRSWPGGGLSYHFKPSKVILYIPGTPNNHFLMDVLWNNHFPCKDLESSIW